MQVSEKSNYKHTLNLPQTSFPMRANLAQNEPQTIKRWQKQNMYEKILKKNATKPLFHFHDGPPYANGDIHVGHLLNKVLKDIVVRSHNQFGYKCPYIPGWDCHGLPIEHKVMIEIMATKKEKFLSLDTHTKRIMVRSECLKYAKKFIKIQSEQMKSLLTLADYDHPYLTLQPNYESSVLDVFAKLVKEGLVFRQLKPVHWSIENQTALAEAELEYYDKVDTSVFVKFEITTSLKHTFNTSVDQPIYLMIWTTTPWTLPANLAVSIHENFEYALINTSKGLLIIAENLIKAFTEKTGIASTTLGTAKGKQLLGATYTHPFCNREGKVVHADYVTLEDGSGLVHTAPGHGIDDYQTGLKEGLEVYCPVKADGCYDDSTPDWLKGLSIWDANKKIVSHLEHSQHLVNAYEFSHSYPHDWRSKTPVIFRSTEQWFIGVDTPLNSGASSLRKQALSAIENTIKFVPEWGKNRLRGMMESRPDWCLSRQRSWGLPIPAFVDKNGTLLLTESSVRTISEVFSQEGSDAWFKKSAQELLSTYNISEDKKAPQHLDMTSLDKMYDIFDVWFESGSSWNAVMQNRQQAFPSDLYLEGSDQHRGWFHLSLLPALGVKKAPPYKTILTHGFIVDKNGKKMGKSTGNALNVQALLKQYGAEVTRWWVSSMAFENDIKVDMSFFDLAGDSYRKVRNTLRFLLSNIFDLDVQSLQKQSLNDVAHSIDEQSINSYILQKTSELQTTTKNAYLRYNFKLAHQALYNFCNDDLSSFYCMATKDILYCDAKNSKRRLDAQKSIWIILEVLSRLLAPILPHTSEEIYQAIYNNSELSIHLTDEAPLDYKKTKNWTPLLTLRTQVLKKLEEAKHNGIDNNLDAEIVIPDTEEIAPFKQYLADIFGVSRVTFNVSQAISIIDIKNEPRCERSWKRDGTVKKRSDNGWLSDRDAEAIGVN